MPDRSPNLPPRPEHPRPHLVREPWTILNGRWDFLLDDRADVDAAPPPRSAFDRTIVVPFPPESPLSGIGDRSFHTSAWYRREVTVPASWDGLVPWLHVGACDYTSVTFVDGRRAHEHVGGSTGFSVDLSRFAGPGDVVEVVVHAIDDLRSGRQPSGKQSREPASHGCYYTRVTGIWQTVWLEGVHPLGLRDVHLVPDRRGGRVTLVPRMHGHAAGTTLRVTAYPVGGVSNHDDDTGSEAFTSEAPALSGGPRTIELPRPHAWHPDDPALHPLTFEVIAPHGTVVDRCHGYVGLRDVHVEGDVLLLNDAPIFLRMVLDQGYWPDGIWTAPSDEALLRDIHAIKRAGFNAARLHQKVFEPRYHHHADRLGLLTWAEMASWGIDENDPHAIRNVLVEWQRAVVRDRNHPSIVGWTPFNETEDRTIGPEHRRAVRDAASLTRDLDPTRPVNDASGWVHQDTDLWTVHLYSQDPPEVARQLATTPVYAHRPEIELPAYRGQPLVVDEFGGTRWPPADADTVASPSAWGYGTTPDTEEAFLERLEGLVDAVVQAPGVRGYCYTQLTDVEQEVNGLYRDDRTPKFDVEVLAKIFSKQPPTDT